MRRVGTSAKVGIQCDGAALNDPLAHPAVFHVAPSTAETLGDVGFVQIGGRGRAPG